MKKVGVLLVFIIVLLPLSACEKGKNSKSEELISVSDEGTTNKSSQEQVTSDQGEPSVSLSDTGYHDLLFKDELAEARVELYDAGINSASINDSELKGYINDAKLKHIDLVTFISENILN
ncbi:hypothetical protein OZX68_05775 [Streptococcaceae bacterium ESL0729]|nr:hypothetical protein OZX68_05775 [Streptococcaceae bacterium ESL0729]